MSSTAASKKIIESFPHPTIVPIVEQPTYETITKLHLKLNTNAVSIHSNRGNGQLDLIFLTLKLEVYNTISTIRLFL